MLWVVQILCLFFSFIYFGSVIKDKASRFDKILGSAVSTVLLFLTVYIEVMLK